MLIRNENDILREVLSEHIKFSDHIFILDGTTEDQNLSENICKSFKNVSYFSEDQLPTSYPRPIKDGCRQFLIERAREKYGAEGWFALFHGDEIFVDSPRDIAVKYDRSFDYLIFNSLCFFIHREQSPFHWDHQKALAEQIYWYAGPGWPEVRLFRNKPHCDYDIFQHHCLLPKGLKKGHKTTFKIKHYPFRDPVGQAKRAVDRIMTDFSPGSYAHVIEGKYYLDERYFNNKCYHWISNEPPKPRIDDSLPKRMFVDLKERFSMSKYF